jgi:hypothetical protein
MIPQPQPVDPELYEDFSPANRNDRTLIDDLKHQLLQETDEVRLAIDRQNISNKRIDALNSEIADQSAEQATLDIEKVTKNHPEGAEFANNMLRKLMAVDSEPDSSEIPQHVEALRSKLGVHTSTQTPVKPGLKETSTQTEATEQLTPNTEKTEEIQLQPGDLLLIPRAVFPEYTCTLTHGWFAN